MQVPELAGAVASLRGRIGSPADPWCDRVNDLVGDLVAQWDVRPTGEPARAGYGGICLPVEDSHALPAMLKVTRSNASQDLENEVLAHWDGRAAVRLIARDDQRHARLLERLPGPSLADEDDVVAAMAVAGDLARRLAVPAPPGLPRMADAAAGIATRMSHAVRGHHVGIGNRDVQWATATYRDLGADQPETALHGDLHGSNVLRSVDRGWVVIDPLGLVGEPALDALTMLRGRWLDLPASNDPRAALLARLHAFADACGTPRSRVAAWTHARCVRAVVDGAGDDHGLHAWTATSLSGGP